MGVFDPPLKWRMWPEDRVSVSEEGNLVTVTAGGYSLTHTGEELTEGRHYWEVEVLSGYPLIGVCRSDADPRAYHGRHDDTTVWLMDALDGELFGNGKQDDDQAGGFNNGDRMGILLDLDDGSLRFFKNGVEHGPGYPAGSVTGPVALAAHMFYNDNDEDGQNAVRLLLDAEWPAGHAP